MGHQRDRHDPGRGRLFRDPLLHDRLERNELLAHPRGDRAHGPWTVNDGEAHVVAALVALHRHAIRLDKRRGRPAKRRHADPARDVDDVGRDRRCGSVAACSRSDQGQFPDRVAVDRDRVEHAHRLGERRAFGDHCRMDPLLDAMRSSFGDAQELDAEPKLVRGAQVGERDGLDSFDRNRACVDLGAESERSENGELMRGVEAANVECRIGLRITEPLGLAQTDLEREIVGLHAREDVIAGAVENAGDALNCISGQALAQSLDDRYAAAHRGLEEQLSARSLSQGRELDTHARPASPCSP